MELQKMIESSIEKGYSPEDAGDKRWIDTPIDEVFDGILRYLKEMSDIFE